MVAQSKNFMTIDDINSVDLFMKKISSTILVHLATKDIWTFYDYSKQVKHIWLKSRSLTNFIAHI